MDFFDDEIGWSAMFEQSDEIIHHEFEKIWNKYKINTLTDSFYLTRFKSNRIFMILSTASIIMYYRLIKLYIFYFLFIKLD